MPIRRTRPAIQSANRHSRAMSRRSMTRMMTQARSGPLSSHRNTTLVVMSAHGDSTNEVERTVTAPRRHAAFARSSFPTCISAPAAARPTGCSTSCAITMPTRSIWSATSSTAGSCASGWYWPQTHNDVVQKLLRKARKGARIVYVPGNHDEFLRDYYGTHFGGIEVVETRHPRGRRRPALSRHPRRPFRSGGHAGALARAARRQGLRLRHRRSTASSTRLRRRLGFPYWSLSQWAKLKVKNAVNYIGEFEKTLVAEAQRHDGRRRDLRPHPSRRDPRRFRHPLHQLRRLGRKLHGDRRAPRRPVRDHALDRRDARDAGRAATRPAPVGRCWRDRHSGRNCGADAPLPASRACRGATVASRWRNRPTHALPTAADVDAAAQRLAGVALAHAAGDVAGARRAHRRARVSQGRDPAAHRLVQVPRRLQQDLLDPAGASAPAAWWPSRPAIMRRASPRRRGCSACRRSS